MILFRDITKINIKKLVSMHLEQCTVMVLICPRNLPKNKATPSI